MKKYTVSLGNNDYTISKHLPVIILLDISGSMRKKIDNLNETLETVVKQLREDDSTKDVVDLCLIAFNDKVRVLNDFLPITEYVHKDFDQSEMQSCTSLGEAVMTARQKAEEYKAKRRAQYEMDGKSDYYQPVFFLLTDGIPYLGSDDMSIKKAEDDFKAACKQVKRMESTKKGIMLTLGIGMDTEQGGANLKKLKHLTNHEERVISLNENIDVPRLVEFMVGTTRNSIRDIDSAERELQKILMKFTQ